VEFVNTMAVGQFYAVEVDTQKPIASVAGCRTTAASADRADQSGWITNADWFRIGSGDGFYVQIDPTDATPSTSSRRTARSTDSISPRP